MATKKFKFKPRKDIDGSGVNNGYRANKAEELCRESVLNNPKSKDDTEDYFVSDMLSDCFHLCDKKGWDVEELIDRAKRQWEDER